MSHFTPEDKGRLAIRKFIAEAGSRASRRLQEPPPEPEPEKITHPDWFGAAWREALGGEKKPRPEEQPDG